MNGQSTPVTISDIAGHPMRLRSLSGDENLGGQPGGPFEYRLELLSPDTDIKAPEVLGQKATVRIELPENRVRYFNGYVARFSYAGMVGNLAAYQATLKPWLWFLNFTADCRIFPDRTVPEIVKSVFGKYRQANFKEVLAPHHPSQNHVVQYRETDFNFVNRLMEQEGIYCFFRHEADKHTLVLADGISAHESSPGYKEIPYVPPTRSGHGQMAHFDSWQVTEGIKTNACVLGDQNPEKPQVSLLARRQSPPDEERYSTGEAFDFPGQFREGLRGESLAAIRVEELHQESQAIEVAGNTWGLGIGNIFTLPNPPRSAKPIEYLVTSAHYEIRCPDPLSGSSAGFGEPFSARYTLLPSNEQFRPRRSTPKPAVLGPQTAIVVGDKKTVAATDDPEEIVTDANGRVRVRFHWERIGDRHPDIRGDQDLTEEDNTCWVRVAQMWAGNRWGSIHIPRIGQEVIVEFLDGDPDRPIIIGSVYNSDNKPPYALPENKTQSGIKSRSTKDGNPTNFNEIRFEDKKGREEFHVQAERDMTALVKHDQVVTVNENRTVTVGIDQTTNVHGKRTTTVDKNDKVVVEGARELTVTKTVTEIFKDNHKLEVTGQQEIHVDKNKNEHVKLAYTLTTDERFQLHQGPTNLTFENTNVTLDSAGVVTVKRGNACVSIDAAEKIKVSSPSGVSLECGGSKIELLPTGIAIAAQAVTASASGSKLDLGATSAGMTSDSVLIEAENICSVMGRNQLKLNTP